MKLASFSTAAIPQVRVGLVQGDEIVDIDLAARALDVMPQEQMLALIQQFDASQQTLRAIVEKAAGRRLSEVRTFADIGAVHALAEVQLAPPIPHPRKNIVCLGLNYAEHAEETARLRGTSATQLEAPLFFTKAITTINGPYGQVVIDPTVSVKIDWEAELGVIIGKGGKNIREEDALSHVFGYTVINDVTARDLQSLHKQYFKGKSLDGYCPSGPWIVTADEVSDPQRLRVQLRVNGETKQDGNTSQMIFPIHTIIAVLSQGLTLEPGDMIATGTPSGVGFTRNPPEFLRPGDIMETEIEGIGLLRNEIVSAAQ